MDAALQEMDEEGQLFWVFLYGLLQHFLLFFQLACLGKAVGELQVAFRAFWVQSNCIVYFLLS